MKPEDLNNHITLELNKIQKGNIKVHTQIINDLSSGIYSSPASCIKELINNSYDADAKRVTIRIKPIHDSITIIDDGIGMNAIDFDNNFAWISKSNKRNDGEKSPKLKRPLIGKIGIGFIAVNEICDELEVISTKKGEPFMFTAKINFKDYFDNNNLDENANELIKDNGIIKAEYDLINETESTDEHYTVIRLLGIKDTVKDIFEGQRNYVKLIKEKNKFYEKSVFNNMHELLMHHYDKKLRSYSEDNEYIKFIIDLSSYIPVDYIENGPIEGVSDSIINKIVKQIKDLDFKVDLDGIFLKKPIFFPKLKNVNIDHTSFEKSIQISDETKEVIKVKGYFYIQHGILYPREVNGLAVRIKGIPIAPQYGFDTTFLQFPIYLNQLFMNWISGEVYVEKGLEDAMNIDRASFRLTHPHYLAIQDFIHKYIHETVIPKALELYEIGKGKREKEKAKENEADKKKILNSKSVKIETVKSIKTEKISSNKTKSDGPINISKSRSKTVVTVDKSFSKNFKKSDWEYLEDIFLIFEMALLHSKGNVYELKKYFYDKINEWKGNKK